MKQQMLDLKMEYDERVLEIRREIPGRLAVLTKDSGQAAAKEEIVREALQNPIGTPPLREIVRATDSVCIIMSDITRYYQRMDLFLPILIGELAAAGVKDEQITLLCALGAHGFQSEGEKALILGELYGRIRFVEHDCRKGEELVMLGTSPNGTPICLNRLAVECDKLILTGVIGFHDMAGYGGGRKSLIPGIASYEGVSKNHLQVFAKEFGAGLNPDCRLGNVDGNPMHQDMVFAGELVKPDFLFNVILDTEGEYYKAVAGDWKLAFEQGTKYCDEACGIPITEKADVVIAGCCGYPKDMNLYQASKGYAVAIEAVKKGGTVLLVAACRDGMGAELSSEIIVKYDRQEDREALMRQEFAPEAYSGYYICEMARHYEFLLVSEYEPAEELEKSGVKLFRRIEDALDYIYERPENQDGLTYVIPHSMSVQPKLERSDG